MLNDKIETALRGIEALEVSKASTKWINRIQEEADMLRNRGKIASEAEDTFGLIAISAEIVVLNQMAEAIANAADKADEERIRCFTKLNV